MKRVAALLIALSVICGFPMTANAHTIPQDRNDCSIEVIVRFDGMDVTGGTLTAIKVGYVDSDDGNYYFYQELTGVRLDDITSPDAPGKQKAFYENNKDNYDFYTQTQSVKNGRAIFSGLPTGLYLIVQNEAAVGFSKLSPFLVGVPYMENGEYRYRVTASIKSELEREPTIPSPTTPDDPKLPQTGQLNWPIPLLTVAGLALFMTGWFLCFGRKRDHNEK